MSWKAFLFLIIIMMTLRLQDSKKINSEEPYFELLTTELVATEERVFNVSRFLPAIRCAVVAI